MPKHRKGQPHPSSMRDSRGVSWRAQTSELFKGQSRSFRPFQLEPFRSGPLQGRTTEVLKIRSQFWSKPRRRVCVVHAPWGMGRPSKTWAVGSHDLEREWRNLTSKSDSDSFSKYIVVSVFIEGTNYTISPSRSLGEHMGHYPFWIRPVSLIRIHILNNQHKSWTSIL